MEYTILTTWDEDARVWVATSDDIPGLVLESGSLDVLIERSRNAAVELLELNGSNERPIPLYFKSERHERIFA